MKKNSIYKLIYFLLLISINSLSQTVLIEPSGITKSKSTATLQDFLFTGHGIRPSLIGQYKETLDTTIRNNTNFLNIMGSGFAGSQFVNNYSAKINMSADRNWSNARQDAKIGFYSNPNDLIANVNNLNKGFKIERSFQIGLDEDRSGMSIEKSNTETASLILGNVSTTSSTYISKLPNGNSNFYNLGGTGIFMYTPGHINFYSKKLDFKNANGDNLMSAIGTGTLYLQTVATAAGATGLLVSNGVAGVNGSLTAVFEDDASHYLGMYAPNGSQTGIAFGKPTKGARSGGIVYTGNADMEFRVNGNLTRMIISQTGNIGVRSTSPVAKFHIGSGSTITAPVISSSRPMVIESALNNEIVLAAPDANTSSIILARPSNNADITYDSNSNLSFNTGTGKQFYATNGNIGFGLSSGSSPQAKVHVDGDFALKKRKSIFGATNHHNLDRQGCSIITVANLAAGGGAEAITGLADGVDGLILHIYPIQGTSITLAHQNASSIAANRIITHTAANVIINNRGGATMIYDASVSKWRLVSISN